MLPAEYLEMQAEEKRRRNINLPFNQLLEYQIPFSLYVRNGRKELITETSNNTDRIETKQTAGSTLQECFQIFRVRYFHSKN